MNILNKYLAVLCLILSSQILVSCKNDSSDVVSNSDTPSDQNSNVDANVVGGQATADSSSKLSIGFSSDALTVFKGDAISIDLLANNMPVSEGGGVTLVFNPDMLQVESVVIDDIWDFVNQNGRINNAEGSVRDILFSSYRGIGGTSRIATITFKAISSGSSEVAISGSVKNPFSSSGNKLSPEYSSLMITSN